MIEEKRKEQLAIDYIAQHSYYTTLALFKMIGAEYNGESYVEIAYPSVAKEDTRSAKEIMQYVLKRLSE